MKIELEIEKVELTLKVIEKVIDFVKNCENKDEHILKICTALKNSLEGEIEVVAAMEKLNTKDLQGMIKAIDILIEVFENLPGKSSSVNAFRDDIVGYISNSYDIDLDYVDVILECIEDKDYEVSEAPIALKVIRKSYQKELDQREDVE